ncbi:MAG: hypothetical protein R3C18_16100 [Planctomycetaceae bacterium]
MIEVGIRHAWDLPILHLAEDGTKLPFDIASRETVFYNLRSTKRIRETVNELTRRSEIIRAQWEHMPPDRVPQVSKLFADSMRRLSEKYLLDPVLEAKRNAIRATCDELRKIVELIETDFERNRPDAKPLEDFIDQFAQISRTLRDKTDVYREIVHTQHKRNGARLHAELILERLRQLQRDFDRLIRQLQDAGSGEADFKKAVSTVNSIVEKAESIENICQFDRLPSV